MASLFPPESLPIIGGRDVPFFWVDGMHEYEVRDGNIFSTFHVIRPLPQRVISFSPWLARARFPNVCIACTLETQLLISRQAIEAREKFATEGGIGRLSFAAH